MSIYMFFSFISNLANCYSTTTNIINYNSHRINLSSDLMAIPDFYWDREHLEKIYHSTYLHLNVPRRTKVLCILYLAFIYLQCFSFYIHFKILLVFLINYQYDDVLTLALVSLFAIIR